MKKDLNIVQNGPVTIVDGFSKLLVFKGQNFFDPEVAKKHGLGYAFLWRNSESGRINYESQGCAARSFKTAKGREALEISPGNSHTLKLYGGAGDRSWENWADRKLVGNQVIFSEAIPTTNGGGCWEEIQVWIGEEAPRSAEEAKLIEEIQQ